MSTEIIDWANPLWETTIPEWLRQPGAIDAPWRIHIILHTQIVKWFDIWDQNNGNMKSWLENAKIWTRCTYMSYQFEVIQSGEKKFLMLADCIYKINGNGADSTIWEWIHTIADTLWIAWLKVMSREQIHSFQDDRRIFSPWMVYASSSTDPEYSYYIWAWIPDNNSWYNCNKNHSHCYGTSGSIVLRCIVELSDW